MKNYEECMAWVQVINELKKRLPEGTALTPGNNSRDGKFTLYDVDPEAITRIAEECEGITAGKQDGEYYYVNVRLPHMPIAFGKSLHFRTDYCFFYRQTSGQERREAYNYIA